MKQKNIYYNPSGSIGLTAILLSLVFGLITSLILSGLYGYLIHYLPFMYFNFILVILYGFIVGSATGIGAKFAKARNSTALSFIALFIGVFSFYFGWVSWMHALTEQNVLKVDLIDIFTKFNPPDLFSMATEIAQKGNWSIFGWTPKGFSLYLIWAIESFMIIFLTMVAAVVCIDEPFCERCHMWILEDSTISPFPLIKNPDSYQKSIEKEGIQLALNTPILQEVSSNFSEYKLYSCHLCNSNHMFTISNVEITQDSSGKKQCSKTEVIKYLLLDKVEFSTLKSIQQSNIIT